jgi:hypothetical protein
LADFHPLSLLQRRDSLSHKNELLTAFRTINNRRRKFGFRADIVNNASNGLSATIAYKFYLRSDFKFTELRFGYKKRTFIFSGGNRLIIGLPAEGRSRHDK